MRMEIAERELLGQPVGSLQYMLRRLALEYDFLPSLSADGIFGERTLEAVMLFQRELYPPVTGVVDRGTWNAIRDRWYETERRISPARALRAFPSEGYRVMPGEEREILILPQAMLQMLSRRLDGIEEAPATGRHNDASADNIRWVQRAAGLEQTGVLDRQTWDMLSRLYELFVVGGTKESGPVFQGGWG